MRAYDPNDSILGLPVYMGENTMATTMLLPIYLGEKHHGNSNAAATKAYLVYFHNVLIWCHKHLYFCAPKKTVISSST